MSDNIGWLLLGAALPVIVLGAGYLLLIAWTVTIELIGRPAQLYRPSTQSKVNLAGILATQDGWIWLRGFRCGVILLSDRKLKERSELRGAITEGIHQTMAEWERKR